MYLHKLYALALPCKTLRNLRATNLPFILQFAYDHVVIHTGLNSKLLLKFHNFRIYVSKFWVFKDFFSLPGNKRCVNPIIANVLCRPRNCHQISTPNSTVGVISTRGCYAMALREGVTAAKRPRNTNETPSALKHAQANTNWMPFSRSTHHLGVIMKIFH